MRFAFAHNCGELIVLAVWTTRASSCAWRTLLEALAVVFAAS